MSSPLHRSINIGDKIIQLLARQRLISHLKEHLLSLNKAEDGLQQRRTTLVLERVEQRIIMNGRLYATYTRTCNMTTAVTSAYDDTKLIRKKH